MPQQGCPSCHNNHWIICPKCGDIYCYSCGKNRNGKKRKACNHCSSCNYVGNGWKTTTHAPSCAKY